MALIQSKLIEGSILALEFRDSISRNSFSIRAAEELRSHLETQAGSYQAVVFSAPGRVFCSGGNLADYAAMTSADPGRDVNRRIGDVLDELSHVSVPTICIVNGDCFGGGLELISAFDVVLSSPYAMFGFWQRKIALTFGWGGGARLEKRLGEQKLKQMALRAINFGAVEAQRVGLIDGICMEALLAEQALAKAKEMLSLPQAPVQAMKNWDASQERETFDGLWWNDEHREILAARRSNSK